MNGEYDAAPRSWQMRAELHEVAIRRKRKVAAATASGKQITKSWVICFCCSYLIIVGAIVGVVTRDSWLAEYPTVVDPRGSAVTSFFWWSIDDWFDPRREERGEGWVLGTRFYKTGDLMGRRI